MYCMCMTARACCTCKAVRLRVHAHLWRLAQAPVERYAAQPLCISQPAAAASAPPPTPPSTPREAMRCDNIIGGLPRKAARDFELGGHLVKEGQVGVERGGWGAGETPWCATSGGPLNSCR